MTTDFIEKQITLKAPPEKVWRALSDSTEFGRWFGMRFDAPAFVAGRRITGRIAPTVVDPEVARMQKPHEGAPVELVIDRIEPMTLFSFKWHPYGIDKAYDYSQEPMTLVTFMLEPVAGGTHLTLTETGFENLPPFRRAHAFAANDGGWAKQMELIGGWLAYHA